MENRPVSEGEEQSFEQSRNAFSSASEQTDRTSGESPIAPHAGEPDHERLAAEMVETVGKKEARKLKARREKHRSIWFGLGMFGMVGWSVALPTLAGVALGCWIDHHWSSRYSWTIMLLFLGVALGCLNAWFWVERERRND